MSAREEARRMAEVMMAFADGAQIQIKYTNGKVWSDVITPKWNWASLDYRVKPKPREEWQVVLGSGIAWGTYADAATAQHVADEYTRHNPSSAPFRIVHMREVTE